MLITKRIINTVYCDRLVVITVYLINPTIELITKLPVLPLQEELFW